jgi:phospholipase/carboxylesterase
LGLLDDLQEKLGVASERVILGGFSQGAMLATDVVLRDNRPFAGLAILSGTLIAKDEWSALMPARRGLPVVQSHGRADPILPFSAAERLHGMLETAGLQAEFVPFNGGHAIPPPALERLATLITAVCARP